LDAEKLGADEEVVVYSALTQAAEEVLSEDERAVRPRRANHFSLWVALIFAMTVDKLDLG
jgi:predicted nucleic acid-binding protein